MTERRPRAQPGFLRQVPGRRLPALRPAAAALVTALACAAPARAAAPAEAATLPTAPAPAQWPSPKAQPPTRVAFTQLDAPGGPYDVEWQLPAAAGLAPATWVLLQHGFARRCANLRGTAAQLAGLGFATLCVNADMAAGAPELAAALATALLGEGPAAWPSPLGLPAEPPRWVLGGHSAGGLFAARVGAALVQAAPQRVAGALLLDPVGGKALADALLQVSGGGLRPVRAVMAPPSRCNARHLALPALRQVQAEAQAAGRPARVAVQLTGPSTHVDAEGEDTEAVAVWACREGWPQSAPVQALRALAGAWALEMAASGKPAAGADQTERDPAAAAVQRAEALVQALQAEGRLVTPGGLDAEGRAGLPTR